MSNVIDSLVKVTISISSGATSEESFNNILLVDYTGEVAGNGKTYDFSSIDDVKGIWGDETELYTAAAMAFNNYAMDVYATAVMGETSETTDDDTGETVTTFTKSETIKGVLNRALDKAGWYGFAIVGDIEEDDLEEIAQWADDNNKLFGFVLDFSDGVPDDYEAPVLATHNYAVGFATKLTDNPCNKYINVAAMANIMTYQPGSETWAYKTFTGVLADEWSVSEVTILKEQAHLNYYVTCAGKDILLDGKCISGEYIDIIRFRDWLLNDIQTRVFNLFIKNAKIPYTDNGIVLIQNQIIASLKSGQDVGGIAETYYDDDGNEVAGYSVTVPTTLDMSDSNRANRILSNCKFTARLAGAIHIAEITGTLTV